MNRIEAKIVIDDWRAHYNNVTRIEVCSTSRRRNSVGVMKLFQPPQLVASRSDLFDNLALVSSRLQR